MVKGITPSARLRRISETAAAADNTRPDLEGKPFEALLRALKSGNWQERDQAARMLGRFNDPRAATSLAVTLSDPISDVRWSAAWALERLSDPRARDFYLDELRNGGRADRWAAVSALGNILGRGDRRALPPLRQALQDRDAEVRHAVQVLIGEEA